MLFYEGVGMGALDDINYARSTLAHIKVPPRSITNDVQEMLGQFEIINK